MIVTKDFHCDNSNYFIHLYERFTGGEALIKLINNKEDRSRGLLRVACGLREGRAGDTKTSCCA